MIRLSNITKSFTRPDQGQLDVLRGIDCEIGSGEFVAVIGPSGSGKSTLMNILGLLDHPDQGEYELAGQLVSGLEPNELASIRNRSIGFVFQQFHLLPRTTAVENVELPLICSDADDPEQGAGHGVRPHAVEQFQPRGRVPRTGSPNGMLPCPGRWRRMRRRDVVSVLERPPFRGRQRNRVADGDGL